MRKRGVSANVGGRQNEAASVDEYSLFYRFEAMYQYRIWRWRYARHLVAVWRGNIFVKLWRAWQRISK